MYNYLYYCILISFIYNTSFNHPNLIAIDTTLIGTNILSCPSSLFTPFLTHSLDVIVLQMDEDNK